MASASSSSAWYLWARGMVALVAAGLSVQVAAAQSFFTPTTTTTRSTTTNPFNTFNPTTNSQQSTHNNVNNVVNQLKNILDDLASEPQQVTGAFPGVMGTTVQGPQYSIRTASGIDGSLPGSTAPTGVNPPGAAPACADPYTGAFVRGYGIGGNVASDGLASGFTYSTAGTLFGVHRWLADGTVVGVLGGYGHTSVNSAGGSSSIDHYQVGLYGKQLLGNAYLQGLAVYECDAYGSTRDTGAGTVANGNTHGNDFFTYGETGYRLVYGQFSMRPFIGLQYLYLTQNGFTETGGGGLLNQAISSTALNSLRTNVGARFAYRYDAGNYLLVPRARLSYWHEYLDDAAPVTASFAGIPGAAFTAQPARLGRDFLAAGVGFAIQLSPAFAIFADYDVFTSTRSTAHAGSGGLAFRW